MVISFHTLKKKQKTSHHIHWCFLETSVSVEFWGGCIIYLFSSPLVAASLQRMWTECIPFSLFPLWATLSHHYRSACLLWNALLGFGMQMLCSGGGGISEESESDEFLINELWNGSPGAIKDELLSISPSSFSISLSFPQMHANIPIRTCGKYKWTRTYKYIWMHVWPWVQALINDDGHWLGVELQENEACFLFYQHIITSPSLCSDKWHAVDAKESRLPSLTSNKASISTPQPFILLKCTLHWRHRAVWWVSDILVSNYRSAVWPVQWSCEVNNPPPHCFLTVSKYEIQISINRGWPGLLLLLSFVCFVLKKNQ